LGLGGLLGRPEVPDDRGRAGRDEVPGVASDRRGVDGPDLETLSRNDPLRTTPIASENVASALPRYFTAPSAVAPVGSAAYSGATNEYSPNR
jgi:hypothetical protein